MRKIVHIDMDCFFVAVEVRDKPELFKKAVAVGGMPNERGVIASASYEARALGVRSALSTAEAFRRCPHLILLRPDFQKYQEVSKHIYQIFTQYSDIVEAVSIDEAYLDLSGQKSPFKTATLAAKAIRAQIFLETGLTASAGIAPNPFLAKVASDWRKPNGQFTITLEMVDEFVAKLPLRKVPGVGRVTEEKLKALGLITCLDLRAWPLERLITRFGKWGQRLYELCRGIDRRELTLIRERKSISVEHTFLTDLSLELCLAELPALLTELNRRLEKTKLLIRSLFVKVKFADFKITTVEDNGLKNVDLESYQKLLTIAKERSNKAIRLIGIGIRLQEIGGPRQLELFLPGSL